MTVCDTRRRWRRSQRLLYWTCDDLPGWCVTATFAPDRNGVFRRRFYAQYRGVTVGEASAGSTPEQVIDALDELLGHTYRSPRYIRYRHWAVAEPE